MKILNEMLGYEYYVEIFTRYGPSTIAEAIKWDDMTVCLQYSGAKVWQY